MNKHFLRCTKTDNKISEIRFETTGKAKVSIIIEDRDIVLQINKKHYVLTPVDPPKSTVFQVADKSFNARVMSNQTTHSKLDDDELLILDGDNNYNINGHELDVEDDVITYDGQVYREGDTITIDGREAVIGKVEQTTVWY